MAQDAKTTPEGIDPAALRIVSYPAKVLRLVARPVPEVTPLVREVASAMLRLMREAEGIGLAAPQVGLPWRMFVVDVPPSDTRSAEGALPAATRGPVVYINPVLSNPTGAVIPAEEGCLSLPDIRGDVLRPPTITITALDEQGRQFTQTATGLLARCWQHENDHLDGVLIIDKMSPMHRRRNRAVLEALEDEAL